jgi:hypothetical protein
MPPATRPRPTLLIVGFEHSRLRDAAPWDLRKRFAKFALELHPGKTRLIEVGRLAAGRRAARGLGKPETFDFLGFTHICGKTPGRGFLTLRRITISKRMRTKLREVKEPPDTAKRMDRPRLPHPHRQRNLRTQHAVIDPGHPMGRVRTAVSMAVMAVEVPGGRADPDRWRANGRL